MSERAGNEHVRLAANEGRIHSINCERCHDTGIEPFELLTEEQRQKWREDQILVPCSDCHWDGTP